MKEKHKNLLVILFLFSNVFLFNRCSSSISLEDYTPSEQQLIERLPPLEPLIDVGSFEETYRDGVSSGRQSVFCSADQTIKSNYIADAASIFSKDVKSNMTDTLADNTGYIVCRLTKYKVENNTGVGLWFLTLGTVFLAPSFGLPAYSSGTDIELQVDILNIKSEIISTYKGDGDATAYGNGLYYQPNYRKAHMEAFKEALDEIKSQMMMDSCSIADSLKRSMKDITVEREIAISQSLSEPSELITGNEQFNNKAYNDAIESYNKVLQEYQYHIYAYLNKGKSLMNIEQNSLAIKNFSRVIELDPENAEAYLLRGFAYCKHKELYAGINDFNKAVFYNGNDIQAYLLRAGAEDDLLLNNDAIRDYRKVLELDPDKVALKDRIRFIQDRIQGERLQSIRLAQQEEQERNARRELFSSAMSQISNATSTDNNTDNKGTNNNSAVSGTANSAGNSVQSKGHIEKVTCSYCKGTGLDPALSYGPSFGLGKGTPYHKKCPSCNGKGYIKKYVH